MNYKNITFLFLSSLTMFSCAAIPASSQAEMQAADISSSSQQAKELDLMVVEAIQGLLQQGYSSEHIIALLGNESKDQEMSELEMWQWVVLGCGVMALGVAVGWHVSKYLNNAPNQAHLVQEVLRVGDMLAQEQARANNLQAQLDLEGRAREFLVAQNNQNQAIIQALNLVIEDRNRRDNEAGVVG